MLNSQLTRKFILYTFFSGFAALINFGSRFLFDMIPGVSFMIAVTLAYIAGMIVNFAFSKWFVFDSGNSGRTRREAIKFILIALLGLLVTVFFSELAIYMLKSEKYTSLINNLLPHITQIENYYPMIAHLFGMFVGLLANFLGHELLSFKQTGIWEKLTTKKKIASDE